MTQPDKSKLEAENQRLKEEIERLKAIQSHPSFDHFLNQDYETAWCLLNAELTVQSCSSSFQSLTGISPNKFTQSTFDLTPVILPECRPDYIHFGIALKKHVLLPKILLYFKSGSPLYVQAFFKKDQILISFQKAHQSQNKPENPIKKENPAAAEDLQQLTEEYYAINEEYESINEELKETNEKLQQEIQEREQALEKWQASEQKFSKFIQQTDEGLAIIDASGIVIEWNNGMADIYEIPPEKAKGQYIWDIEFSVMPPGKKTAKEHEKLRETTLKYLSGKQISGSSLKESSIEPQPDQLKFLNIFTFQYQTQDNIFIGRITHDITKDRLLREELEMHRHQLEKLVKQKTRQLENNEQKLHALSNNLPGGAIFRARSAHSLPEILYISSQFDDIFGLPRAQLIKDIRHVFEFILPEDREQIEEAYQKSLKEMQVLDIEFRIQKKQENLKWIKLRAVPQKEKSKEVLWDGLIIDITNLKETEKYLSLNQYSIDNSNNAIYWFGPTGRFRYVNQQACKMLGYTKEELLQKHVYDISNINPEIWEKSWRKLKEAKSLISEFTHTTKSGKQIPVEVSANYFIYEGQEYVFSVATDISERKKTEEQLIESEKNHRSLFEQAVDGILMGNDKGVIIDANESICQMSGYNKSVLIGNKINILFPEEELNQNPLRYDLLKEGREVKRERKLQTKEGNSEKIIEMNTKSLSDGRLQAFIRDVTEKKKAAEAMEQAADIFNHIQTGLLIYHLEDLNDDRTLMMVNANPACKELLGIHPDEMIGKTIDQNFPDLRAKGIPQRFAEVARFQELYETEDLTYEDERVLKNAFSFKAFPLPNQQIGVAFENISEKKMAEEAIAYQRSFEQLITHTSSQFIHIPHQKIDISIETSIGMLCRQIKASAGYLLKVDEQQELMQMTHYWHNKDIDIQQEALQSIQKKDYPDLFESLTSGQVIAVEKSDESGHQNKDIAALNFIPGNKTFLKIPIIHQQKLIAVLGFASVEKSRKWNEVERDLLGVAGQIFINAVQRKHSEEALSESERSYREVFNSPSDAIFILDAYKGHIIDLNDEALKMLETDKKNAEDTFVQSHKKEGAYSIEQMKEFISRAREEGEMRFEWFSIFNGSSIWSEVSLKYAQINGQERILAVARDVTKKKNAEKKLEDTNKFLEGIINTSYNIIYVRDIKSDKLLFISERIEDLTQYTVEECMELNNVVRHLVYEEDYPAAEKHIQDLMKKKAEEQVESELRIKRKDGQIRWMHINSAIFLRDEAGNPLQSMAVMTDITNRKKAEEALRISQQRLKLSLEATNDGLWDWYLNTGETYFSPQYYKMLGYKPGEFTADYDHWHQLIHPEDVAGIDKAVKETIEGKSKGLKHEFRMKTKSGSWCWILARGGVVEYNEQNHPTRMAGTHTDISDRKKAEQEIRQSQFFVEQIANTVPGFLYVRDIKTHKHLFVNQDIRKLLGYKEFKGDTKNDYLTGLMDQGDRKKYLKYLKDLSSKQSNEATRIEYKLKNSEGEWRWYREWSTIFLRDEYRNPLQILGIAQDITFAKTAEKTLEENERKFHELFESSNDSIMLIENETIIDCNKHTEEIFLFPKTEIIGRKLADLSPKMQTEGELSSKQFTHLLKTAYKKGNHNFEWICKRQNGTLFHTDIRLNLVKLQEKTYVQAVLRDISNRKKSERALVESEKKFRNIFNNSSDFIVIINLNNMRFAEVNDVFINACGYSREELINKNALDVLMPDFREKSEDRIKRMIKGDKVASEESEIITKKGKIIPVELSSKIIDYENDIALLTVARNIEERKQLQQKLFDTMIESEEKERQRIAGDLHDEIGPILSSLKMYILTLNSTNDLKKTEYVITQVKTLIKQAITTVREISNDLSPHLLTNYGLDAAMQSTLEHTSEFAEIDYQSNIGEQRFNPNIEIVYYRIIKELLNNTFKHASADHITIHLNLDNGTLQLYYADNGKGFDMDEQMDLKKEGIGIYSILNRIKTISGHYEFGGGKGKGFIFKLNTRVGSNHQNAPE